MTNNVNRPRGLCRDCYYTPGVRERYPKGSLNGTEKYVSKSEPTAVELEAMIAEQMKTLPKWWAKESAKAKVSDPLKGD